MENILKNGTKKEVELQKSKLESLLEEGYKTRINNLKESFKIINSVLGTTIDNEIPDLEAKAHKYLGLLKMIVGEHSSALEHSYKALEYYTQIGDTKSIADAKYNISSTLYKTDNFHEGLKGLLECLQLYKNIGDLNGQTRVLKSAATIFEYLGETEQAYEYYLACILISEKTGDLAMLSNAYNPLSGIYLKKNNIKEALALSNKSIQLKKQINDERGMAYSIYGLGKVYLKQKQHKKALECFKTSLDIQQKFGDKLGEGMVLNKLGETFIELNDFETAEKTLNNSINFATTNNIKLILYKSYYNLYILFKKMNKLNESIHYLEKYLQYKEIAINSKTNIIVKSYESAFKIDRLEKESKAQKNYNEIIEKKNQELDSFFYKVSHDLKGPISSLMGLKSIIEYENFDDRTMLYFNMYHQQVGRIHSIVYDLINITRLSSDTINLSIIDFNKLINECIQSYSYFKHFKNIKFNISVENELNFKSEWIIINTILQNLIENSIKYVRSDVQPIIKIKIYKKNNHLIIKVKDNGLGIPLEFQNKIFDMFFRATEQSEGSGLGLYILKRAVERLHGQIKLKSTENKGSIFRIILNAT